MPAALVRCQVKQPEHGVRELCKQRKLGCACHAAAKLDSEGRAIGHQLDVFGDKHPEVSTAPDCRVV